MGARLDFPRRNGGARLQITKTALKYPKSGHAGKHWARALALAAMLLASPLASAAADAAKALHLRYSELREELAHNEYQRPLYLDSTEAGGSTKGDAYVVVQHPFDRVVEALSGSQQWCDVLILHMNTKYCRPGVDASGGSLLHVAMGRKFDQELDDAYPVEFAYRLLAADGELLQVELGAADGPMGTRDYRILFEAVPLGRKRSFIHLSYAYSFGMSARLAMQAYLATLGNSKVGFTVVDRTDDGEAVYVDGVRGAVERNTMRYSLAIEAYLGAWTLEPRQQLEKRLNDWFTASERYPLQLHEMDRDEYLAMKHKEVLRQQAPAAD